MNKTQTSYGTTQASKLTGVNRVSIKNYVRDGKIDGFINPINGRAYITELGISQLRDGYKRVENAKIKTEQPTK